MSPPDSDKDFFDELDDDLGEDWESAFQAEDFMFSPGDNTSSFFQVDENHPEDNEDLPSLMDEADTIKKEADIAASGSPESSATEKKTKKKFAVPAVLATINDAIKERPAQQKIILGLAPLLLLCVVALFLFKSNNDKQLAQQDDPAKIVAATPPPEVRKKLPAEPTVKAAVKPTPASKTAIASLDKVRQKWPFHSFLIMTEGNGDKDIFINIDLTIIAALAEDAAPLSADRRIFLRDAIYQFYKNRPLHDLRRYALARGDMIHHLNAWLKKQWSDGPIETVMFSRYQVIKNS